MRVRGDYVALIKEVQPEYKVDKVASGLYLPESMQRDSVSWIVKGVGEDVTDLKKGDRVILDHYVDCLQYVQGVEYTICKSDDIVMVL